MVSARKASLLPSVASTVLAQELHHALGRLFGIDDEGACCVARRELPVGRGGAIGEDLGGEGQPVPGGRRRQLGAGWPDDDQRTR
jgi:hypothetical protein